MTISIYGNIMMEQTVKQNGVTEVIISQWDNEKWNHLSQGSMDSYADIINTLHTLKSIEQPNQTESKGR